MESKTAFTLFAVFLVGVLVATAIYLWSQAQRTTQLGEVGGTTFAFVPDSLTTAVGTSETVPIVLDTGGNKISAVELYLSFDVEKIHVESITEGDILPVVLSGGNIDTTKGSVSIVLGAHPTKPKRGSGTLALVTIRAVMPGSTSITFANTSQAAAIGKRANVLSTTTPLAITITPKAQ